MSDRVLKWVIPVDDEQHEITGIPLFVGCQDDMKYDEVVVWTQVSVYDSKVRKVQAFATGQPLPRGAKYVWTVICAKGSLVWHLFDVTNV